MEKKKKRDVHDSLVELWLLKVSDELKVQIDNKGKMITKAYKFPKLKIT